MNNLLLIAVAMAGFGFALILFQQLKKGAKLAKKLPINFLAFFLVFAILGLSGFFLKDQIADKPLLVGLLVFLVALSGGTIMTNRLYEKLEWSISASFGKKLLYLSGITLLSILTFTIIFLLCEHRGWPQNFWQNDMAWWLAGLIPAILLPLIIKHLHLLWNEIPKYKQLIPVYEIPLGSSPPFIEAGGPTINFRFIIPLDYGSSDQVKSTVAFPFNKTLAEAFHYKLHEHNIVKRFAKKIIIAEAQKRSKVYGWSFFQEQSIWWGWRTKKNYLDPKSNIGATVSKGQTVFVERVKVWEN